MEAAGIEPEFGQSKELTTSGQNVSNSGQSLSKSGQPLSLRTGPDVEERTSTGQNRSIGGQNLALKWPQKEFARFPAFSNPQLLSELQEVVDAWETIPQPLKDGILAIVRGQEESAVDSGTNSQGSFARIV